MIFVPSFSTFPQERRGIVLLVVMAMLTLFAAVGLSFVFYAEAESTASSYGVDAAGKTVPDVDPELLLAYFLGQLIYDVDDTNGVYSAMRGNSLARNMYGYQSGGLNMNPYNGVGRLHTGGATGIPAQNTLGQDDFPGINYMTYNATWTTFFGLPAEKTRYPELYNSTYVGSNVSYTYPDFNNMFLAAVNGNGEVLTPSFFRTLPAAAGGFGPLGPTNTNWNAPGSAWTKYLTLRPLPAYNNKSANPFPAPEDGGGDVKNLPFGPGTLVPGTGLNTGVPAQYYNNDSIWMDLGFPVQIAPNGQKYKPMFAALIIDLDRLVNLNVHGNSRAGGANGASTVPASNQGWGQGEVNISQVLTAADWINILKGNGVLPGRYGPDGQPGKAIPAAKTYSMLSPGPQSSVFPYFPQWVVNDLDAISKNDITGVLQVPYDATIKYSTSTKRYYPGETVPAPGVAYPKYYPFPQYDLLSESSGDQFERTNHWMIYNFFKPKYKVTMIDPKGNVSTANADDTPFRWSEMEALLRYGDTGSPALSSSLFALSPLSFQVARARRLVTTHSFDLGRPGLTPWLFNGAAAYNGAWPPPPSPSGLSVGFPAGFPANPQGEFGADFRGIVNGLDLTSKLSLNRPLPDYPAPDATGRIVYGGKVAPGPANKVAFDNAQKARQQFAQDIFNRLCWVTTGGWINAPGDGKSYWFVPGTAAPGTDISTLMGASSQYNAFQWLAQVAVNIVDYVDNDSIVTPFNWDTSTPNDFASSPNKWVFGTELPRVLINEAYAETQNDPADPKGLTTFRMNFWAELVSPLPTVDASGNNLLLNPSAVELLQVPAAGGGINGTTFPVYKLVIQQGVAAQFADTTLGTPKGVPPAGPFVAPTRALVKDFTTAASQSIKPLGTAFNAALYPAGGAASNDGFYVLGPDLPTVFSGTAPPTPTFQTIQMRYSVGLGKKGGVPAPNHSMILQRLACPNLPPNDYIIVKGVPTLQFPALPYNPYVTVDYVNRVPANDRVALVGGLPNPLLTQFAGLNAGGAVQTCFAMQRSQPYSSTIAKAQGHPITGAAGTPITITSPSHGFIAGDKVFINGVLGNTAANNSIGLAPTFWTVTKATKNNFTLDLTSASNAKYKPGTGTVWYADRPQHTLFRHNSVEAPLIGAKGVITPPNPLSTRRNQTLKVPFDYLAHLDRYAISPMELLSVSAYPPYLLTKQFMTSAPVAISPITGMTGAGVSPIVVTAASTAGLTNGGWVTISGVQGNSAANGTWAVAGLTATTFQLVNSTGNGGWTAGTGKWGFAFTHLAPWVDTSAAPLARSRLYRFLEQVNINNRAMGVSNGGRIPGPININTIWPGTPPAGSAYPIGSDLETFMALCDPQTLSTFNAVDVQSIFSAMIASRTPSGIPGPVGVATATDRPFKSFATGYVASLDPQNPQPFNTGVEDTILRPTTGTFAVSPPTLFDLPPGKFKAAGTTIPTNPVLVKELLSKIYGNLTTRSNTFVVFLTVGFFAVDQDTDSNGNPLLPPVLGAEIGKSEGRNIRHRMFALIDRTELRVIDIDSAGNAITGTAMDAKGNPTITPLIINPKTNTITSYNPMTTTVTMSAITGPMGGSGSNWTLTAGMALEVDVGSGNEETVVVQSVAGNTFTATFYKNHPASFTIVGRGNPGPWSRYNPRNDTRVVPYFSIIE